MRGPEHIRARKPNQDACLVRRSREATTVVVCDGLGSREHSGRGARAACRSVVEAVRHWSEVPEAPTDLLLRAIHALWNIKVHERGAAASATTCLFAVACADGRLVLAQLGDGIVMLKRPDGCVTLEADEDKFGNETIGLGISRDVREWRIHVEPPSNEPMTVFMATDGVADDLLPERREGFLQFVLNEYALAPSGPHAGALAAQLKAWPTPKHRDDKTVALLWNDQVGVVGP